MFKSVRDFYATPESLNYYVDRARSRGFFPPERAMVERFMSPPAAVLDVGCGAGREAFELARTGYAVTGVDIVPELLEQGRAIAAGLGLKVELLLGDGKTLDFVDGRFDYVLLITQLIHHIPMRMNRVGLLREAARVLKPEGTILLTYHDEEIAKNHKPWGGDQNRPLDPAADNVAAAYTILEPGDSFSNECQGRTTAVYGYYHACTRDEMEAEVSASALQIAARDNFLTIAGGEPDEFWKPTQILVLERED